MFDAYTKPEFVRQWLLGPAGWTMPVCEIDLRVGGSYRYVWRKSGVPDMGMGGVFREIDAPGRLVATERFDESWYAGEALDTTVFSQAGDVTQVTITILYESQEARDTASRSGMERGMAAGYNRLEELLASEPRIVQTAAQMSAIIHLTIPRGEIQAVMGPGLTEVMAAVKAQGIGPAGPWFTHHRHMNPATFDFEICVPVTSPVTPGGRVEAATFPALTVARTIHQGNYSGLSEAWGEFGAWIAANGHTAAPDLYECYAIGPDASPDPANWRTELSRPLLT